MNIYESIANIIKDCPAIAKDSKNTQGNGYMYRGIDAVMNVFQPLLAKYKVFVVPQVLESEREERVTSKGSNLIYSILKVKYTFYAEDGSSVEAIVQGEGMDSGDKASNKAMSAAFKYAMFQAFCVPTEEMIDSDSETPEESTKNVRKTAENTPKNVEKAVKEPSAKKVFCPSCGKEIKPKKGKDGTVYTPEMILDKCCGVCFDCFKVNKVLTDEGKTV